MATSFESVEEAEKRSKINENLVETGLINAKSHVANFDSLGWTKKDEFLHHFETLNDGSRVNWSGLADRYKLCDETGLAIGNRGQTVKQYAKASGVDVQKFSKQRKKSTRRGKKRLSTGAAFPSEPSSKIIMNEFAEKLKAGKYTIGVPVAPRKYTRLIIEKGVIKEEQFVVEGRKISLTELRERFIKLHHKYMRLNPDSYFCSENIAVIKERLFKLNEYDNLDSEDDMIQKLKRLERTRYIQLWHDASVVINHGHILYDVNIIYDPAAFYTEEEMGIEGIQEIVEKPEVYLVGRCRANDEQLAYSETRLECLLELSQPTKVNGEIVVEDVMRFFHGDGPASQIEAGHQKGGNYFCVSCPIHAGCTTDIYRSYIQPTIDISDRIKLLMAGEICKSNTLKKSLKPLEKLKVAQLRTELKSRGLSTDGKQPVLLKTLQECMCGVQRIPMFLYNNPSATLESVNASRLEIQTTEPVHDIGGHAENLFCELPGHMDECTLKKFDEVVKGSGYSDKQMHRTCDRRLLLLRLVEKIHDGEIGELFKSLSEIQRILYLKEEKRCSQNVLRLSCQCHLHFHQMLRFFNKHKPITLSWGKLFGKYLHDLLCHAALSYRLLNGRSMNVEKDEAVFNTIKSITNSTSNRRPGHIIGNLIVRLQAEDRFKKSYTHQPQNEMHVTKEINKYEAVIMKYKTNTIFSLDEMTKFNSDWMAFLETRIPDFIKEGPNKWYTVNDSKVEFFDLVPNGPVPEHPMLHSFRSWTMKDERRYLKECWDKCLENDIAIPVKHVMFESSESEIEFEAGIDLEGEPKDEVQLLDLTQHEYFEENEDTNINISSIENEDATTHTLQSPNILNKEDISEIANQACPFTSPIPHVLTSTPKFAKASDMSKECKAIARVLKIDFSDKNLQKLQSAKNRVKKYPNSVNFQNDYHDLLAPLQTQVLRISRELKNHISEIETDFAIKNNLAVTTEQDRDRNLAELIHTQKYAQMLLTSWRINID